jgi:hypothetical protein
MYENYVIDLWKKWGVEKSTIFFLSSQYWLQIPIKIHGKSRLLLIKKWFRFAFTRLVPDFIFDGDDVISSKSTTSDSSSPTSEDDIKIDVQDDMTISCEDESKSNCTTHTDVGVLQSPQHDQQQQAARRRRKLPEIPKNKKRKQIWLFGRRKRLRITKD